MKWMDRKNAWPFVLAVAVHVGLLIFFIVNLDWVKSTPPPPEVNIVNATIVDETQIQQEVKKLERDEQKKREQEQERKKNLEDETKKIEQKRKDEERKVKELEQQRVQEEKRLQETELRRKEEEKTEKLRVEKTEQQRKEQELQKLQQAETEAKQKKAAEEAKKKDEAKKKKEEEDRQRKQAEEEAKRQLDDALKQEAAEMDAARTREVAHLRVGYIDAIRLHVKGYWRVPPTAQNGMKCVVDVIQAPTGAVISAAASSCSQGDPEFQRSVEAAVYRASPLPKPSDPALYDRELRFTLTYEAQN